MENADILISGCILAIDIRPEKQDHVSLKAPQFNP